MHTTKLLCIGDQHIQTSSTNEFDKFALELNKYLTSSQVDNKVDNKVDIIVLLGDMLHTHERLHTSCLNKAISFVNSLTVFAPVYILVGNHDMINHLQFLSSDGHWLNCFKDSNLDITVCDKVKTLSINNKKLVFCPYVEPGRFIEALNTLEEGYKDADIVFCHQEFFGCKMGAIESSIGDKIEENFPQIISGHIHDRQKIQNNIYYTGSCMQHAFGENSRKSIALLTLYENTKEITEVYFKLPIKKIIYKDIETIDKLDLSNLEEGEKEDQEEKGDQKKGEKDENSSENKIKISISGTYEQFKTFKKSKKYKELCKKGIIVVYKPKKITVDDITIVEEKEETTALFDFDKILKNIIDKENNINLKSAYNLIFGQN